MTKPYIIPPRRREGETDYYVYLREDTSVELGKVGQDQLGWRAFHPVETFWTTYETRLDAAGALYDYYRGQVAPKYPEAEKLLAVAAQRNAQEAFLEWLGENGYYLAQERCPHGRLTDDMVNCEESAYCRNGKQDTRLWPIVERGEDLVMRCHDIDVKKLDGERRAMLAAQNPGD